MSLSILRIAGPSAALPRTQHETAERKLKRSRHIGQTSRCGWIASAGLYQANKHCFTMVAAVHNPPSLYRCTCTNRRITTLCGRTRFRIWCVALFTRYSMIMRCFALYSALVNVGKCRFRKSKREPSRPPAINKHVFHNIVESQGERVRFMLVQNASLPVVCKNTLPAPKTTSHSRWRLSLLPRDSLMDRCWGPIMHRTNTLPGSTPPRPRRAPLCDSPAVPVEYYRGLSISLSDDRGVRASKTSGRRSSNRQDRANHAAVSGTHAE